MSPSHVQIIWVSALRIAAYWSAKSRLSESYGLRLTIRPGMNGVYGKLSNENKQIQLLSEL